MRRPRYIMPTDLVSQLAGLFLLGSVHGINPAMGWLFAVALGLQERGRRAVWGAFLPLAIGHGLAIAAAAGAAALLGIVVPAAQLEWLVAAALAATGIRHLLRHRHVRWGGMRMRAHDLAVWSFLMASVHGAGLMTLPLVLDDAPHLAHAHGGAHAAAHVAAAAAPGSVVMLATLAHSLGYLVVTCLVAVIVYERVGVRVLRAAWLNIDYVWAIALVIAGLQMILS